jgi:hypothetical protein
MEKAKLGALVIQLHDVGAVKFGQHVHAPPFAESLAAA